MSLSLAPCFFRHEYGRLVAMFSRRVGVGELQAVEDAVQAALLSAVDSWPRQGLPENPGAWLFRVASNRLLDELQRRRRRGELAHGVGDTLDDDTEPSSVYLRGDVEDDLLRMLFVCCSEALPVESQLMLALKVLCGFGVREIADRLFTTEASVYKRLGRAQRRLRAASLDLDGLTTEQLASRLPAVQTITYLLFTEGYLSSQSETPFREELCAEAKRLATLLAHHPVGATPETFALLALMHLHSARSSGRRSACGGLVLLEEQDRSLWNAAEIQLGLSWLARSASGQVFSRYHAEAGIAAEHCLAASFAETRWARIVECYELLERTAPSALHTLNRAVAVAEHLGPVEGLRVLDGLDVPPWLERSHVWHAVRADLHGRCGQVELARWHAKAALERAPSRPIADALERRLAPFLAPRDREESASHAVTLDSERSAPMKRGMPDCSEPFAIRPALPSEMATLRDIDDDAGALYAIHGLPLDLPPDHVFLRDEGARWLRCAEGGRAFVAVDPSGAALGFAALGFADGEPYLEQLSVRVAAMRRGIGKRLLGHVADAARTLGGSAVWLTTYAQLSFNRPYYERHGYTLVPETACGPELRHHLDEQRRYLPEPAQRVAMRRAL
jgi:RNA polymerase sigma-70 factor (ECF subfamily)